MKTIDPKTIKSVTFELADPLGELYWHRQYDTYTLDSRWIKHLSYERYIPVKWVEDPARRNLMPATLAKMPRPQLPEDLPAPVRVLNQPDFDAQGGDIAMARYDLKIYMKQGYHYAEDFYMELNTAGCRWPEHRKSFKRDAEPPQGITEAEYQGLYDICYSRQVCRIIVTFEDPDSLPDLVDGTLTIEPMCKTDPEFEPYYDVNLLATSAFVDGDLCVSIGEHDVLWFCE